MSIFGLPCLIVFIPPYPSFLFWSAIIPCSPTSRFIIFGNLQYPQGLWLSLGSPIWVGKIRWMYYRDRGHLCLLLSIFPLCMQEAESRDHIFIHCVFSTKIWDHFKHALSIHFAIPNSIKDLFALWSWGLKGDRGRIFLKATLHGVI